MTEIYCKGKTINVRAYSGLEGSRRLKLQDFEAIDT